jgi:hypothetical protein
MLGRDDDDDDFDWTGSTRLAMPGGFPRLPLGMGRLKACYDGVKNTMMWITGTFLAVEKTRYRSFRSTIMAANIRTTTAKELALVFGAAGDQIKCSPNSAFSGDALSTSNSVRRP